jgi:hypothetical protein
MPSSTDGRRLMAMSLAVILVLNVTLSVIGGSSGAPVTRYGLPALVALACILVWQGRGWARLLLVLLSIGVLLAGPIMVGNGVSPLSVAGALGWLASILCAVALGMLYLSPSIRATLTAVAPGAAPSSGA